MPSRLIKVLVPEKEEYEILADVLREERAKNARDSNVDDDDLQSKTSKETYRAQRTRAIDRDNKKLFLYHATAEDKISAPSDASSDKKRSGWKAWISGQSGAKTTAISSLLTSQSRLQ
jgi:hypothetical protein